MNKLATPREKKSQQMKERIFNAAVELLKKYGYEYLTVKNICETAGVSNGTFYYYFKTKDDLLSYYFKEGFDNKYSGLLDESKRNETVRQQIISAFKCYGIYTKELGLDFVCAYYNPHNTAMNVKHEKGMNFYLASYSIDALAKAQQDGWIADDIDIVEAGHDICTIIKGIILDWCVSGGETDLESYIEKLLSIYLDSLGCV